MNELQSRVVVRVVNKHLIQPLPLMLNMPRVSLSMTFSCDQTKPDLQSAEDRERLSLETSTDRGESPKG